MKKDSVKIAKKQTIDKVLSQNLIIQLLLNLKECQQIFGLRIVLPAHPPAPLRQAQDPTASPPKRGFRASTGTSKRAVFSLLGGVGVG